jgi:hypothetical protein
MRASLYCRFASDVLDLIIEVIRTTICTPYECKICNE